MTHALMERPTMTRRKIAKDEPIASIEQRRQLAFDALATLDAQQAEAMTIACKEYDAADNAFSDALAAYRKAEEVRRRAYIERSNVGNRFSMARSQHERTLKNTADPRIAELIDDLRETIGSDPLKGLARAETYEAATQLRQRQFAAMTELTGLWRAVLTEDELVATLNGIARDCGLE